MKELYHLIFATKSWKPIIDYEIGERISERLIRNFTKQNFKVLAINYQPDHFHILLKKEGNGFLSRSIAWVKGETSHWINSTQDTKFYWQKGYKFYEVDDKELDIVRKYIADQGSIHQKITLYEEIDQLSKIE